MVMQRIDPFREFQEVGRDAEPGLAGRWRRACRAALGDPDRPDAGRRRCLCCGRQFLAWLRRTSMSLSEDGVLTINAETPNDSDASFIIRDRRAGKLYRALRLPNTLDVGKAESGLQEWRTDADLPQGGGRQGATPGNKGSVTFRSPGVVPQG